MDKSEWTYLGDAGFSTGQAGYVSMYMYQGTPYVAYRDYANDGKLTVQEYDSENGWEVIGSPGITPDSVAK